MKIKTEAWILFFLLSAIWGSSFILIKRGVSQFDPIQVGCIRISAAGLALLPVAIYHLRKIKPRQILYAFLFGLCNAGLPAFLFAFAQTRLNSSTSGILNSLTPIFTLSLGVLFFKVPFNIMKALGVLLGLCGAFYLVMYGHGTAKSGGLADAGFIYYAAIIFATVLYGISSNIIKTYLQDVPGHVISAFSYSIFMVPMVIWLFVATPFVHQLQVSSAAVSSLWALVLLGLMGSALAIVIFSRLVQAANALFASFVTYMIPFVSILWGLADSETVHPNAFIGLFVILAGIFITTLRNGNKGKAAKENA